MTKQDLLDMVSKLQSQADSMPDDTSESPTTTSSKETNPETKETPQPQEETPNNEVEESTQIEPQTNGKVTDDITPKLDTSFQESTTATETVGVEQMLSANFDKRFATILTQYTELKMEVDKMKVALSEILTRIELVQEVTDKVTTVDHDSLLSESIKLLI